MEITSASDMLADGADSAVLDGVEVRKGTVAAWVANVRGFRRCSPMTPTTPNWSHCCVETRQR